jgi:hypothetical protein
MTENTHALPYRSLGVNGWRPFDWELIELGAELGFNDLQITIVGSHYDMYFDFRGRAKEAGLFDRAQELGMTTTLWVREFYNQNARWGLPRVDNDLYWEGIRHRYQGLCDLYPEVDYVILTLVESDRWVVARDEAVIEKTVNTINDAVRAAGKTLIMRTFCWHREHAEKLGRVIPRLPDNILISTKCVGNDWNYRQPHHFLIGNVAGHKQIIEMNLFGTWQREHYVANAYTDEIRRRFHDWVEAGVYGVFVPPDGRTRQSRPIGNAQEMNLWAMGRLAAGETDLDAVWARFVTRRFGSKAAEPMIRALKPTGQVLDEAVHVGKEMFGHIEKGIPALRMMVDRTAHVESDKEATHVPEELEKYDFKGDPFTINFSTWRWDPDYIPTYHRIRKGAPEIVVAKAEAYAEKLASARESLATLETAKEALDDAAYRYIKFKLEENEFNLIAMCEAELAWLKASQILYADPDAATEAELAAEIEGHLASLLALVERKEESLQVRWQGIDYDLHRGEYINILGFIDEFRRYWGMETGRRFQAKTEETLDTRYGPVRVVKIGPTTYFDWGDIARKYDLSDRDVIWVVRRALTRAEDPSIISG